MFDLPSEQLPVGSLTPYEKNAKKHPSEQVQQIVDSIRQFGMNDPIAVWGPTNLIVEGHGRLLACKKLGIKTVPVIRLDHLSEEQRKAYALAHNKLTMNSDFDFDMLTDELAGIVDIDMTAFGFDLPEDKPGEVIEDEFDATPPEEPITKLGDIWQLGRHRLMCGDSTDAGTVALLMDGKQSDVWDIDRPTKSDLHPTMKPITLVARAIENSSKSASEVLDLFGGSGSTLIACEQLNRACYMMELDPRYCDVIIHRWETLTGETAKLL
mgnify:CR=1 FL=1